MSERKFPNWLDAYDEFVESDEPPTLYKKWSGISAIASVLQRKCWLRWIRHAETFANMYIVLVGPSGIGKSQAMGPTYNFLRALNIETAAQSTTRQALIQNLTEATASSINADGEVMSHCSLTIYSKELSVFLGFKDMELIAALTDWYDCEDPWTYRTRGRGKEQIDGIWVNLLGATTPNLLHTSLPEDAIGGGLTSRIVFVYADKKSNDIPIPFLTDVDEGMYADLLSDLEIIHMMEGQFKVSEGFITAWIPWYASHLGKIVLPDEKFSGYASRKKAHVLKLSMIQCAARTSDMVITEHDLARAIADLDKVEENMDRVYLGYGRTDLADMMPALMFRIEKYKRISRGELLKTYMADIRPPEMDELLGMLKDIGYIKVEHFEGQLWVEYIGD